VTDNRSYRVLVFDDDDSIRLAVVGYLMSLDHLQVDGAATLAEARELFRRGSFDGVVTDLDPGSGDPGDGLDFIQWLRNQRASLPILVLTAHDSEEIQRRAEDLRVDALLVKPKPLGQVAAAVENMLTATPPEEVA